MSVTGAVQATVQFTPPRLGCLRGDCIAVASSAGVLSAPQRCAACLLPIEASGALEDVAEADFILIKLEQHITACNEWNHLFLLFMQIAYGNLDVGVI